ncbi:hypothetical protein MCEKH37_00144 [Methylophilaceae bacterium]
MLHSNAPSSSPSKPAGNIKLTPGSRVRITGGKLCGAKPNWPASRNFCQINNYLSPTTSMPLGTLKTKARGSILGLTLTWLNTMRV